MQDGDVQATYADVDELFRDTGFMPATSLDMGSTGGRVVPGAIPRTLGGIMA